MFARLNSCGLRRGGQFEKAVNTQKEAIALLQTEVKEEDYRHRLKLFELRLP
jgi:hypothetical protein